METILGKEFNVDMSCTETEIFKFFLYGAEHMYCAYFLDHGIFSAW
jgi:hypothetical protein